ncbi:MAG: malto-oligosyltrehalose trehalohydrolase [Nitrospirae bacterium]|nr:MAG: malto-oligosyltrehalose trehalohydrolase [Nitrospirota bacterium]
MPIRSARPSSDRPLTLGATWIDAETVRFRVWSPYAESVAVRVLTERLDIVPLTRQDFDYWEGTVSGLRPGMRYRYVLNQSLERPDPASRWQPDGVHGPSAIVKLDELLWTDRHWTGFPLESYIIYELHTGTFTPEGTFEAIIPRLPYLRDEVGITAIELMPVGQFPGARNWGYDGTYLFAPQSTYGGPSGLQRLVDACHAHGLAVVLDVVYNHLGPEGNYLGDFGPYFTDRYRTPWGNAINYDGPDSDQVRDFVISNAIYWIREYHIDALRLDAIHGIFDFSAKHILQELGEAVHTEATRLGRQVHVIAESDLNDSRIITSIRKGGYGLDGQWNDDFHHALHCLLTGERQGYYQDFGKLEHLAMAYRDRFVYTGQYSPFRRRRHGNSAKHCAPSQFVVCAQNHDQIGNRAQGDRHSQLISFEALKVAQLAVLCAPYLPLLFMGEEYGETAPFLYFIDHGDPQLIEAVRQGRLREFAAFGWENVPDPYDITSFERSRLNPRLDTDPQQRALLNWCQVLIRHRKSMPSLGTARPSDTVRVRLYRRQKVITLYRQARHREAALIVFGFDPQPQSLTIREPKGTWICLLDSQDGQFGGTEEVRAPQSLRIGPDGTTQVALPAYPAWVFVQSPDQVGLNSSTASGGNIIRRE